MTKSKISPDLGNPLDFRRSMSRERVHVEFGKIPVLQVGKVPRKPTIEEQEGLFEVEGRPDVKFKILGGGEKCEFILEDFTLRDVAKLRRIFYSSLEVMAIELVEILENETDFLDEVIAQRLGLVPIYCEDVEDVPMILNTEDINDELGDIDKGTGGIPFSMNVTNTTRLEFQRMKVPELKKYLRDNDVRIARSDKKKDLIRKAFLVSKENVTEADIDIEDPRCKTVTSGTPIFFLRPGQKFELQGLIQKGVGSMHAKWIPVAKVTYEHKKEEDIYILKIFTTGALTCREIITRSLEILEEKT